MRLDASLSTMLASTFVGGKGYDAIVALALNQAGEVYVAGTTGVTGSCSLPFVKANAADQTCVKWEGFVARLDAELIKISATYIGGSENDSLVALALDSMSNVYVLGSTYSLDVPGVTALSADPTPGATPPYNDGFASGSMLR